MAIKGIQRKCIILAVAAFTIFLIKMIIKPTNYNYSHIFVQRHPIVLEETPYHREVAPNWRNLTKQEENDLSVLGRILYLAESPPIVQNPEKQYQILIWKYGKTIERRHMKNFSNKFVDPFDGCSVKNCEITYEDKALNTADLVIFHLHRMSDGEAPNRTSTKQIWTFLTDESPYHTFMKNNNLANYNGLFNWSMTYRMDSDIPVPYGRTVPRKSAYLKNLKTHKRRDTLVAIMGSNCNARNKRWAYVKELQKHINVDVYGRCGTLECPGHFDSDCPNLDEYLFYLAFENTNCDQYVTEKVWWNAYAKDSIPVIMGGSEESYKKLLPPNSFLHVDNYASPKDLAMHMLYLNSTKNFQQYYGWKKDFKVLNEHGYFKTKSHHYCRACEALNYNDKKLKIYENLIEFWKAPKWCKPAWNAN